MGIQEEFKVNMSVSSVIFMNKYKQFSYNSAIIFIKPQFHNGITIVLNIIGHNIIINYIFSFSWNTIISSTKHSLAWLSRLRKYAVNWDLRR